MSVRVFARVDDGRLAARVETGLKKLGYTYLKNQGRNVTEFDVQTPCHFLVTVENQARERVGLLLRSRVRVESALELKRTVGARETGAELRPRISALVEVLCSDLPDKRWNGLLALRSKLESIEWERPGEPPVKI